MAAKRRLVRTFNYTNRVRLAVSGIDIETGVDSAGRPVARVRRLELPSESETRHDPKRWRTAHVVLDAWRNRTASWMSSSLGSVLDVQKAKGLVAERRLEEFETPDGITFRIKVVANDNGQLLAEAERVLPSNEPRPSDVDELLPVRKEPSLGQEPWRIDWTDTDRGPVALVSAKLVDAENFFRRDGAFAAAMVPEMLRSVLIRLSVAEELQDQEWAKKWYEFAARFYDGEPPQTAEWSDAENWANEVVARFCEKLELVSKANAALTRGQPLGE